MKTPIFTNRFAKDLKLMTKRGRDPENIKAVMRNLIEERLLDRKFSNHVLIGNFKDRRECHIEPDWLSSLKFYLDRTEKCVKCKPWSVSPKPSFNIKLIFINRPMVA